MKQELPAKTVDVCDICHRQTHYLMDCDACGVEFCLNCQAIIPGSFGFTDLCKACQNREDVKLICDQYAEKLAPIFRKRDDALRGLRNAAPDDNGCAQRYSDREEHKGVQPSN